MSTVTKKEQNIINTELLHDIGEHFTNGHFSCPSPEPMLKYAWGLREVYTHARLHIAPDHRFAPLSLYGAGMGYLPIYNGMIAGNTEAMEKASNRSDIRKVIEGLAKYWSAYNVENVLQATMSEKERHLLQTSHEHGQQFFIAWQGHATINYRRLLDRGFVSFRQQVTEKMADFSGRDKPQRIFYESLSIVTEGIETLIQRNNTECQRLAGIADDKNQEKMQRLQTAFEQMLVGPPRSYYEALEFVLFFNAIDGFDNVGRMDQYLWPFYQNDTALGLLTPESAQDMLVELMRILSGCYHWQIVVGGLNQLGQDAANDLTLIIMNARRRIKEPKPSLSLRVSCKTPDKYLHKAAELLAQGLAHPALYNEELYCQELQEIGTEPADAVEFTFGGCSETHIAGKGAIRDAVVNITTALEAALYNGHISNGKTAFGLSTGSAEQFPSFDAVLTAYKQQVEYIIDTFVMFRNRMQEIMARLQPALVRSIFIDDCIEKGQSHTAGGARYNHGLVDVYGVPNVANSLYTIKQLVFEQSTLSLNELITALQNNFHRHDAIRELCLDQLKYGNDHDQVDLLAGEVFNHVFDYIRTHRIWNGGSYYGFCAHAANLYISLGKQTGATPDGRRAGEPLANAVGPMSGTDTSGPLAMLNSVTKLDLRKAVGTPVVNMNFSPGMFASENQDAFCGLIRTYFKRGGMQLQLSAIDKTQLQDAMIHPENHRNLFVRVSGYCARFIDLDRESQDEFIQRTVF